MTDTNPIHNDSDPDVPADRPVPEREEAEQFAIASAQLLKDYDCDDIRVLDVRGVSPFGRITWSSRRARAIASSVRY